MILKKNIIIVGLILLISISFWSFKGITNTYYNALEMGIILFFIIYLFIFKGNKRLKDGLYFKKYVILFMFLPFLSIIPCYFIHDQPIYLSLYVLRINFCWLFYFVLHHFKISEKDTLKIVFFIALVWVLLEAIQQVTYPVYYFYTRGDDIASGEEIEIRANIYRFMINGVQFAVLILLFYVQRFYESKSVKNVFWILFFLFGIYLMMTRQILFAALLCLVIAPLIKEKSLKKIVYLLISLVAVAIIYYFRDILFGSLIENTAQHLEDNVRYQAYAFFLSYWEDWSCLLLGNGPDYPLSSYGEYINSLKENFGIFRSDIGIVGELSKYGIIYVVCFLFFCYHFLFKLRKGTSLYQKLYFIYVLIIIAMVFPFRNGSEFIFFSMFLYLCDLSINKKKELESNTINQNIK